MRREYTGDSDIRTEVVVKRIMPKLFTNARTLLSYINNKDLCVISEALI